MIRKGLVFVIVVIAVIIVAVFLSGWTGVRADGNQITGKTLNILNVHVKPDGNSDVIGQIPAGSTVIIAGRDLSAKWLRVQTATLNGWAAAGYVRLDTPMSVTALPVLDIPADMAGIKGSVSGTVRASFLIMRSAPNDKGTEVGNLGLNATVILEGRNAGGTWLLIHTPDNAQRGWVAAGFIKWAGKVEELPVMDEVVIAVPNPGAAKVNTQAFVLEGTEARFRNNIVLTIDDCSVEQNVRLMFQLLKNRGLTATFFPNTQNINQQDRGLWREIVASGFEIGYHTRFHMSGMNSGQLENDFNTFTDEVRAILGDPTYTIKYIRPPRGIWDRNWLTWGAGRGLMTVKWNAVAPDVSVQSVLDNAKNGLGNIVLMHTGQADLAWLRAHIDELSSKYRVRSVSDALKD